MKRNANRSHSASSSSEPHKVATKLATFPSYANQGLDECDGSVFFLDSSKSPSHHSHRPTTPGRHAKPYGQPIYTSLSRPKVRSPEVSPEEEEEENYVLQKTQKPVSKSSSTKHGRSKSADCDATKVKQPSEDARKSERGSRPCTEDKYICHYRFKISRKSDKVSKKHRQASSPAATSKPPVKSSQVIIAPRANIIRHSQSTKVKDRIIDLKPHDRQSRTKQPSKFPLSTPATDHSSTSSPILQYPHQPPSPENRVIYSHSPHHSKRDRVSDCAAIPRKYSPIATHCSLEQKEEDEVQEDPEVPLPVTWNTVEDKNTGAISPHLQKEFFTVAEELQLAQSTLKNLTVENSRLQKKLENMVKENEFLKSRHVAMKVQNDQLSMEGVKTKNLALINEQLQAKVNELYQEVQNKDLSQVERENRLAEAELRARQMEERVAHLTLEMEQLKMELMKQERQLSQASQMKMVDLDKDLRLKQLHNQLIEMRGNIRVLARFKPAPDSAFRFHGEDLVELVNFHDSTTPGLRVAVDGDAKNNATPKMFRFNRVLRPSSTQSEVFEEVDPFITSSIDGYNVCILSYGQTGSGKTYTMQGTRAHPGIISRAIRQVMSLCSKRVLWTFKLSVSILQIYNEVMMDLLSESMSRVTIQDDGHCVKIRGLQEFDVNCEEDIVSYIRLGRSRRTTSETYHNSVSSRSHFIVMLRVRGTSVVQNASSHGVLTLCDLAGFEKIFDSPHAAGLVNESKYIGKSLAVLGRVFDALRNRERVLPFRDSKLTHLLKPSLSGDAKCVLILTVTTATSSIAASIRTLMFGQNAMQVSLGQAKKNLVYNN